MNDSHESVAAQLADINLMTGTLVFETCLKLGKLQCKYIFTRNEVLLLMIENFETNQIVLCVPGG